MKIQIFEINNTAVWPFHNGEWTFRTVDGKEKDPVGCIKNISDEIYSQIQNETDYSRRQNLIRNLTD